MDKELRDKLKNRPIKIGAPNSPERKKWEAEQEQNRINTEIANIEMWFNTFYSIQLEQYERAQRTNTTWSANDGEKIYITLAELDIEANRKQEQYKKLKETK